MNFNNTNFNLYKSFVVVYETRNLHRAAEILGVSRSAVGQNIKELNNQLGVILFTSTRKGVIPTSEANNLYPNIKNAITAIVESENSLQEFNSESGGIIKIAMTNSVLDLCIKDYLKEFCTKYPKVSIEFFGRDSMDLLKQGKIDFIIELDFFFKNQDIKTIDLFKLSSIFVVTKDFLIRHNLKSTMTKDDLMMLPIITQRESWFEFFGSTERFIISPSSDLTYIMAKNSLGVGFYCKELLDKTNDPDLVALNIKDITLPTAKVVCGYNNSLSRPARAFIDGLLNFVMAAD